VSSYSPMVQKLAWNLCTAVRAALDNPDQDCGPVLWSDVEEQELYCSIIFEIYEGLRARTVRVQ